MAIPTPAHDPADESLKNYLCFSLLKGGALDVIDGIIVKAFPNLFSESPFLFIFF